MWIIIYKSKCPAVFSEDFKLPLEPIKKSGKVSTQVKEQGSVSSQTSIELELWAEQPALLAIRKKKECRFQTLLYCSLVEFGTVSGWNSFGIDS